MVIKRKDLMVAEEAGHPNYRPVEDRELDAIIRALGYVMPNYEHGTHDEWECPFEVGKCPNIIERKEASARIKE